MYIVKNYNHYGLLFMSVLFVSLIVNLLIRKETDFSYLTLDINDMSYITLQDKSKSILYIIIKRIKHLILLLLLIKAFKIENIYKLFIGFCGVIIGIMITVQVYYLGLFGIVAFILYVMPHFLIYYLGINYAYKEKLFSRGYEGEIKKIGVFMLIIALGIVLECTFMTFFLKNFYQYMVS